MMRALVCVVMVACSAPAPTKVVGPAVPPPSPPVAPPAFDPPQPPLRLPTNFLPERYAVRLALDPAQPTFSGEMTITGALDRASAVIWLHGKKLHVRTATANGTPLVATPRGEDLLELRPAAPLPAGHYTLALAYDGAVQPRGANEGVYATRFSDDTPYLVTQFEATSARTVFPCVDEPGSKVPWQLALDVPSALVAVANTPVARETAIDATHKRVDFALTRPLPSYLIAFGVGPFDVVDAGHAASGTPLRIIAPHGQANRAAYAAATLPKIVDALAAWTDIPFPYPKLDVVARDDGGAMENAGLIMMDTSYLLFDDAHPSPSLRHNLIGYVGHETAHQWFGDLVTAAWWDDIWLNESFAQFMEDKVQGALEPSFHATDFQLAMRANAAASDSLATTRKIRQPIENEGDIHNAFDGVTYSKGATVLAMFEAQIGADVFQRGIRAYLRAHADRNATETDVVSALSAAAGTDLAPAFASFIDQPGIPELTVDVTCAAGQPARAQIAQQRYIAPGGTAPTGTPQLWKFPLCIAYDDSKHARREACATVSDARAELSLPGSACPTWVLPDAGAHAYVRLALTEQQASALRDHAWAALAVREHVLVFQAVMARVSDGKLPMALGMSFVPKLLAGPRSEIGNALGDGYERGNAGGLPMGLRSWVPPAQIAIAKARVGAELAPLAKRLGLAPRPSDTLDDELARLDVASASAWAGDAALSHAAVALAAHEHDIPASTRGMVLALAADASPAVAAKLRSEAPAESNIELRDAMFHALGSIHDPARLTAMLDLALDPHARARDVQTLLFSYDDEPTRRVVSTWTRTHLADLQRVIPTVGSEDFPPLLFLVWMETGACDPVKRDEIAAYVTKTFAVMPSAARPVAQAIESMDQCIAKRALVEPSLRAWLAAPSR